MPRWDTHPRLNRKRRDAACIESAFHGEETLHATHEQSGTDDQREGEADLQRCECVLRYARGTSRSAGRGHFGQGVAWRAAQHAHERADRARQRGDRRYSERERQNPRVDRRTLQAGDVSGREREEKL